MIIDILATGIWLFFFFQGFRNGFVPTLLALLGYVSGGFSGLLIAREVTANWDGFWSVLILHLFLILAGAKVGQSIFRSLGKGVRGLIPPLKLLDSILGAILGSMKALVLVFLGLRILSAFAQGDAKELLIDSQINTYLENQTPDLIDQGFEKLKEISR